MSRGPAGEGALLRADEPLCVCVCVCVCVCAHAQSRSTLCNTGLQPARLPCPRDFPGKNTGVGCHFPLQGIFPILGLNPHLWHRQANS